MNTTSKIENIFYGAVHDERNFRYIGFCKKVCSKDIQKVDVYIDGKKIETLYCNETVDKISTIYDKAGFAFQYDLSDKYIGGKHLINFTSNEEELENSPIQTISIDDVRFNEYRFTHSLNKTLNEEKLRDLYCKDAIGFLAVEKNLEDEDFMNYIKELVIRFPLVTIKAFYFNDVQKVKADMIFAGQSAIEFVVPKDIYDMARQIEIYLWDLHHSLDIFIVRTMLKGSSNIAMVHHYQSRLILDLRGLTLSDFDKILSLRKEPILISPKSVGFTDEEVTLFGDSYHRLIYNSLMSRELGSIYEIDLNKNALNFLLYEHIRLVLGYSGFKKYFIKMQQRRNFNLC